MQILTAQLSEAILTKVLQEDSDVPYSHILGMSELSRQEAVKQLSDVPLTHIVVDGDVLAVVAAQVVDWDTKMTGLPSGRLTHFYAVPDVQASQLHALLRAAMAQLHTQGITYITTRIQGDNLKGWCLQQVGFRVFDGLCTMGITPTLQDFSTPDLVIEEATADDHAPLEALAAKALTQSRFDREPLIPRERVEALHQEWLRNALKGHIAEIVLVARVEQVPVGFATIKLDRSATAIVGEPGIAALDLIAVAPEHQGKQIGRALTHAVIHWCATQGIPQLLVSTQIWNARAIRCYARTGFVQVSNSLTYRHFNASHV